jgi:hypothetical protein
MWVVPVFLFFGNSSPPWLNTQRPDEISANVRSVSSVFITIKDITAGERYGASGLKA